MFTLHMSAFNRLKKIVEELRGEHGCPWDKAQTLTSMRDDFIEEVYEAVAALDKMDVENIREELGDVLLHVVLHSRIAQEEGLFSIEDVIDGICEKLIRRHPHVFGNENISEPSAVVKRWEEIKSGEKKTPLRLLDKADKALPPLEKAHKLQAAAAKAGFDFPTDASMFDKIKEEFSELNAAFSEKDTDKIKEEIGDLLFALANLSRRLGFTASEALRSANAKFVRRFNYIEDHLTNLQDASLDEMDALWRKAKEDEQI
ncbi:MAG: nucleoside triphosphate pyrophosphohydrolase [Deferribacteraceae bacterium]|jgi:tetrapyrrole methylase family protein/MazG family protein|nr:nucleoside triphosphate pyrophosphohydrolase [Deferribacteraceae bacterium]